MLISRKRHKIATYFQWKSNRKSYVVYRMAPVLVTLNDLEGHSPVAGLFKCNPSNICAVFYQISTDSASRGPLATAGLLVQMAAAAILNFWKFKFLTVRSLGRPILHNPANFMEIGQSFAKIWRFFSFFKMAAVRHFGFVGRLFGPPTKSIWRSLPLCKIW